MVGQPPPEVPMELHALNREKVVRSIRQHLTSLSRPLHGFIFVKGGEEQTRYCTDHAILFRQESYFAYLFGVRESGFYGAIDIATGKSILFAPRLSADYAVWLGEIKQLSYFKERYMVSTMCFTDEIVDALQDLYTGPGKPLLFLLHGLNTDNNKYSQPAELEEMEKFDTDLDTLHPILSECRVIKSEMELSLIQYANDISSAAHVEEMEKFDTDLDTLHPILSECRVIKSEMELSLIQYANDISSAAHVEVMRRTRAGMKEYQLESIFLHHVYMYGGCRHCSYTCICATGENSAVLHYGHAAAPNDRVNGKFTEDQRLVYDAVLKAHNSVISAMRPGISWIDMHKLAEKTILESLKAGHILVGDVNNMMEARLGAVFMPHGLGHFLGIDTHDPGGYNKGMERPSQPGLKALRTVRELQEGMVITVEPGCYFVDPLLLPAVKDSRTSTFFNHDAIGRFKNFGGVRIESDVHVTAKACENLTRCPREAWEIEAVMAGAPWPLDRSSRHHDHSE